MQISGRGFFILLLACASPANASGGAHVIDDASVETPGRCHLESWFTRYTQNSGLLDASLACTRKALPSVEIGGTIQHSWNGKHYTTVGPALKFNIRNVERGWGVALAMAGNWRFDHHHLESGSVVVPVTVPIGDRLQLNFNAGYLYFGHGSDHNAAFAGAQAEVQLTRDLGAMGEVFSRDRGPVGGQAGLRWNPGRGDVDVDLLVGRYVDGASPRAITLGLTMRH